MHLAPQNEPKYYEAIFRAAEIKALRSNRRALVPPIEIEQSEIPETQRLVNIARRELERRAVRKRYLPNDLFSDIGWWILLDLFISDYDHVTIKVTEAPWRWDLSQGTAARHIAALIETNLVMRVFDARGADPVTLRVTDLGRLYLKRVLALCE